MTVIHPHWQNTDDVRKEGVHIRISHAQSSRRPAAILGISFVLLCGILLLQSTRTLTGQLTESSSTVRITPTGLEPASIAVLPGTTITWKNVDTKPHILSSDTLQTTDGLLYSTAIFPEEEFRTTIAEQGLQGSYPYISLTDPTFAGTVRIEDVRTPPLPPPRPLIAGISPQNLPKRTTPVPSQENAISSPPPKPFRHPETGIPLGISSLLTLTTTLLLARRILRSPCAQASIRP